MVNEFSDLTISAKLKRLECRSTPTGNADRVKRRRERRQPIFIFVPAIIFKMLINTLNSSRH